MGTQIQFCDEFDKAPRGVLEIVVKRNGRIVEQFRDTNLIVNTARENMARLIAGDGSNRTVTHVLFGTNGQTPSPDDTAITGAIAKAITRVTHPTATSTQFEFTLLGTEANGMVIREFGLRCGDGSLFARKTRNGKAIEMDNDLELSGYWTIYF